MSASVVILPTDAAIDAAWDRYTEIARRAVREPALLTDREHCTALAYAWDDFCRLTLARRPK